MIAAGDAGAGPIEARRAGGHDGLFHELGGRHAGRSRDAQANGQRLFQAAGDGDGQVRGHVFGKPHYRGGAGGEAIQARASAYGIERDYQRPQSERRDAWNFEPRDEARGGGQRQRHDGGQQQESLGRDHHGRASGCWWGRRCRLPARAETPNP
jgi:hypothetical protein